MSASRQKFGANFLYQNKGTAMAEFALVSGVLLLIIMAILDFGHAYFLRQTIINASREGARYAVIYRVDTSTTPNKRLLPKNFTPSVKNFTETLLSRLLPAGSIFSADPSGSGYDTGLPGEEVIVTARVTKNWFCLHNIMNFFGASWGNSIILTATTSMRVE